MSGVTFRDMLPGDVVQLALQPSQHVTLGINKPVHSIEDGQQLVGSGPAWTAIGDGRILCCYGLAVVWPAGPGTGGHALAWAMLAENVGRAHLAITRFGRARIAKSGFSRVEAVVRADVAAELLWMRLLGLELAATLRAWGPEGRDHQLFERIQGDDR